MALLGFWESKFSRNDVKAISKTYVLIKYLLQWKCVTATWNEIKPPLLYGFNLILQENHFVLFPHICSMERTRSPVGTRGPISPEVCFTNSWNKYPLLGATHYEKKVISICRNSLKLSLLQYHWCLTYKLWGTLLRIWFSGQVHLDPLKHMKLFSHTQLHCIPQDQFPSSNPVDNS